MSLDLVWLMTKYGAKIPPIEPKKIKPKKTKPTKEDIDIEYQKNITKWLLNPSHDPIGNMMRAYRIKKEYDNKLASIGYYDDSYIPDPI